MPRTWNEIVSDYEALATDLTALNTEARALAGPVTPPVEPPKDEVIFVDAGESVQAALDAAEAGAIVELATAVLYPGRLMIRKPVTLRTRGAVVTGRVTPEVAGPFAQLPDGFKVTVGTTDVWVGRVGVGGKNLSDLIEIGEGDADQSHEDDQPSRIVFDQMLIVGDPAMGAKRGIAAQGRHVRILRSHIADIFRVGQDTQCVGGWNGVGPFLIEDCYLAAAGENVMFGGSPPSIQGLIPSDIEIAHCTITKPLAWKGSAYTVKNLIEFKSGKRISIHHNELSNMWSAGQPYALVITPSQYGDEPENTVEDYVFEHNEVLNISNGFNILGHGQNQDTRPTATSTRLTIRDNWFRISRKAMGGNGWFMMIGNGPRDLVVEHNTIQSDGTAYLQGNTYGKNTGVPGFRFNSNIVQNVGTYGTSLNYNGTDQKRGAYWKEYFAPDGQMQSNAFAGDESTFKKNLPDNLHVSTADAAGLVEDGYGVGAFAGYGRRRP